MPNGTDHFWVMTQRNCYHKNVLGNGKWMAVDSIKKNIVRKAPFEVVFEKEVFSHSNTKCCLILSKLDSHIDNGTERFLVMTQRNC